MITLPALRRRRGGGSFALSPARRTGSQAGLTTLADFRAPSRKASGGGGWQSDALTYYESLPPVGFVMDFKATTVAACDFNVVKAGPDGKQPVEGDERVDRLMAALVGPRGGISELRRRAAVLLEVTGEAYLVGTPVEDQSEAVWWEFLSIEEVLPPDGTAAGRPGEGYRRDFGDGSKVDLSPETYIARMWRSDARFSARAHCGLRRCLDTCRELVLLSQMTEAIIASRLPMGLLLVPDTIDWNSPLHRTDETSGSDGDVAEEAEFLDDLAMHLSTPITDFGSAATLVPLVIRASAEDLQSIKVVDLARSLDQYGSALREEMYGRLAVGLDVPPEILEGKGGLNHWTGFNIDNEFLFKHVKPVGDLLADFVTYAYLRPLLEAEGVAVDDAADYYVEFDASPLANNQDDDKKALSLWEDLLISDRAVVEKQGWDPDQVMPADDERTRRLLEKMVLAKVASLSEEGAKFLGLDPAWFKEPAVPSPFGPPPFGRAPADGDPPAGNPPPEQQPGQPDNPNQADQDKQPDTNRPGAPTPAQNAAGLTERLLAERLAVWADAAWERALSTAGNRILTLSRKVPAFAGRYSHRSAVDIPASVGPADLTAIGASLDNLLGGAWTEYTVRAQEWIAGYLTETRGLTPVEADTHGGRVAGDLAAGLDRWGRANFHCPRRRDRTSGLRVPADPFVVAVAEADLAGTAVAV